MKNAAARTLAFIGKFVVAGLAIAFVVGVFWPDSGQMLRAHFGVQTAPAPAVSSSAHTSVAVVHKAQPVAPAQGPASYSGAVQRAAPSVVNIYANKLVTEQPMRLYPDPLMQRLFGGMPAGPARKRREQSLGSGVIFNSRGYVITNNHVIAGAQNIQVLLYDGRVAQAKVVGSDPDTDLAVLKIDAGHLPAIHIATRPTQVGDVVLAIGNPLGIGQTVTMGIISAIRRQLPISSAEDFIQTDAAINFGNSGGALVNARGNLVGINTALLNDSRMTSGNKGAEGISFAIPVKTAKFVLDQIIAHGQVVRGWLGIDYGNVPVASDSGLPAAARGVYVTDVFPGSPAAQAGLQPGDVLLNIGKHAILDPSDLRRVEAAMKPGTQVQLSGLRNGSPFSAKIKLGKRPTLSTLANAGS